MREVTSEGVKLAYVDQGYTGDEPAETAAEHGIQLHVVKRFRRLARNYERLPETFAALHYVAFVMLMLARYAALAAGS